ncbi:MAG: radical SAM protein [Candidatus Bathyarchaeia archaeon]
MVVIREVRCRSVLNRTNVSGGDYCINPYIGCLHGCVYCYARFMKWHSRHKEGWGEFVDVKVNAPQALSRQLVRAKRGLVLVSTVTDPYQPIEREYEITRRLLERLLRHRFPISVLTKSSMVVRDMDMLREFGECDVGLTITTLDDEVRRVFEPKSPSVEERLAALETLHEGGIRTYAFLGPILPFLTEETLDELLQRLGAIGVERVLVDRLNIKWGNWPPIREALKRHYPELLPRYVEALFSGDEYFERARGRVTKACRKAGVDFGFCY